MTTEQETATLAEELEEFLVFLIDPLDACDLPIVEVTQAAAGERALVVTARDGITKG